MNRSGGDLTVGPRWGGAALLRAGVLAFEAGQTLVLERAALVEGADRRGIAIVGVHPVGGGRTGAAAPEGSTSRTEKAE